MTDYSKLVSVTPSDAPSAEDLLNKGHVEMPEPLAGSTARVAQASRPIAAVENEARLKRIEDQLDEILAILKASPDQV